MEKPIEIWWVALLVKSVVFTASNQRDSIPGVLKWVENTDSDTHDKPELERAELLNDQVVESDTMVSEIIDESLLPEQRYVSTAAQGEVPMFTGVAVISRSTSSNMVRLPS